VTDTDSQRIEKVNEKEDNIEFLEALTVRCETKKSQFDKRNMLRTNEEAALAQAIAILNSDSSFEVFQGTDSASLLQMSSVIHRKSETASRAVRANVIKHLLSVVKSTHSLRLARTIASLAATNPFEMVVKQIRGVIALIDKEEETDVNKKNWCDQEEDEKTDTQGDQQADLGTLRTNIANLETGVQESQTNIEQAEEDLASNKAAQASETSARSESHANFQSNLKNLQNAQAIITKAIEVLTKYFDFLKKQGREDTTGLMGGGRRLMRLFEKKARVDSGGSNLEQIEGNPDVSELEKACAARKDCAGFNTAGWLKSAIAPTTEWYNWDGGDLYVKDTSFLQGADDVEDGPTFSTGFEQGNSAIRMLNFIKGDTKDEAEQAMDDEKSSQMQYETNMKSLSVAAEGLDNSIAAYKDDKAKLAKRLQQAKEDEATTDAELKSTVAYLAEIEPGCTFIQSNLVTRQQARTTEKSALEGAISTLEGSPAYQNYAAAQESEDLGKCSDICNGEKDTMTAECQACIHEVTVFGYCSDPDKAADVSGCSAATATSSDSAMNAP